MAFGKSKLDVASTGGWRQRRGVLNNQRKQVFGGGRSGGGVDNGARFRNVYRPTKGKSDLIRIVPGSYSVERAVEMESGELAVITDTLEYYECIEHRAKSGHTTICSAGPLWMRKKGAKPCEGCAVYWSAPITNGKRKSRIGRRDISVFTVLAYGPFINIEQVDKNGVIRCDKEGKPYYEWVPKYHNHPPAKEEKLGHLMHWSVGFGHMGVIEGYDDLIGKMCKNCGTEDSVYREVLLCQECETDLVDCDNTKLSEEQQNNMLVEPVECTHCGHVAPLKEHLGCRACNTAERTTVFDVDIKVMRLDKGDTTQLIFQSWSKPHPVDPQYAELAKPLPLDKIYAPTPLETQRKWFGISEPTQSAGARPYGQ